MVLEKKAQQAAVSEVRENSMREFEFFTSITRGSKDRRRLLGVQPWSAFMQRIDVAIRKMHFGQIQAFSKLMSSDLNQTQILWFLKVVHAWQNPIAYKWGSDAKDRS